MNKMTAIVILGFITGLLSGCGVSYEGVKPTVVKPAKKAIYDIDVNRNAFFYSKEISSYNADMGVIDLRMAKNSLDYPVSAYINAVKVIVIRYKDPTTSESGELLLHSALTGENVFDMRDSHFVYMKTVKKLAYYDIEKFSNRKIRGIKYLKTRTAMKKVFIVPNTEAKKLLTLTKDNKIVLWKVGKRIGFDKILYKAPLDVQKIILSPSGKYIAYTDKTSVHILALGKKAKEIAKFPLKDITALNFSPSEHKIAVATKNATVVEYSIADKKEIQQFSIGYREYANGISYADGEENIIVTASNRGYMKTWVLIANKYIAKTSYHLIQHSPDIIDYCTERNKFIDVWYESRKETSFYKKYAPVETQCSLFGSKEQVIAFGNRGILNKYINAYIESMHLTPKQMKQYKTDVKINLQLRKWFFALNGGQYYGMQKIFGKIFAYGTGHRGNHFGFTAVVIDKTKPSLFVAANILNSYAGVMKNYTYDLGKADSFRYTYYNAVDQYDLLAVNKFTSDKEYHGTYLRVEGINKERVIAAKANKVEIWDVSSEPKLQNVIVENGEVSALAYNKKKNILAIGSTSKVIKIWDLNSMKIIGKLSGHTYKIRSLAFYKDGEKLISSGYYDKSVRIWDIQKMKNIKTLTYKCRSVQEVAISPDQKSFAVDIRMETSMSNLIEHSFINIYESDTYKLKQTLKPKIGYIRDFKYSEDGEKIYAVSAGIALEKKRLHRFAKIDLTRGKTDIYKFSPDFSYVTDFVVLKDEKAVVVSGTSQNLLVLDLKTLDEIKKIDMGVKGPYNNIPSISVMNKNRIITGSKINNVNMFSFH